MLSSALPGAAAEERKRASPQEMLNRLARRLRGLTSTIASKQTRVAGMQEELARGRGSLSEMERWRAVLQRHDADPEVCDLKDAQIAEYQRWLRAPPAAASPQETRFALLLREEHRLRQDGTQLDAAAREVEAEVVHLQQVQRARLRALLASLIREETAHRAARGSEEAAQRAELLLHHHWELRAVMAHEERLLSRERDLLAVLQREREATEGLCDVAQLRLAVAEEDSAALARDQDDTRREWEDTKKSWEAKLERLTDAEQSTHSADEGTWREFRELLQRTTATALAVIEKSRGGPSPSSAPQCASPSADTPPTAPLSETFLQETGLMLKALAPLLRNQQQATAQHIHQLDALLATERAGLACSRAALHSLAQEQEELSRLLR